VAADPVNAVWNEQGGGMSGLVQHVRYAVRSLSRRPSFTLVATLTLALGIGANTAIFSVVHGVLLRPLPYPDEDRLVSFWMSSQGRRTASLSQPELLDLQTRIASLDSVAGMHFRRLHLGGDGEPRLTRVVEATPELLPLLRVPPAEGRFYGPDESLPDGPPVVVVSQSLRRRLFGEDASAIGKQIVLSGTAHTVVGVMPGGFSFPQDGVEAYRPLRIDRANPDLRNNHNLWAVGRLRRGASLEQARSEIAAYGRWAVTRFPQFYSGFDASFGLSRLRETLVGTATTPLLLLLGAVSLVLLIACANVANLLLARGEERRRETAVRLALGAQRRDLARQLLVESAVLALLGAGVALPLAAIAIQGFVAMATADFPRLNEVGIDTTVLAYTLGVAVGTSLLFGLAPLLRALRTDVRSDLQSGVRTVSSACRGALMRRLLVSTQVALAVVLVAGASLLTRTILSLASADVGFSTENSIAVRLSLPDHVYRNAAGILAFVGELEEGARALPGVEAAGVVDSVPLWQGFVNNLSLQVRGREVETVGEAPTAMVQKLSPGALAALELRLQRGAAFTAADVAAGRPVALVNETFARSVLAGEDPLAARVRMFGRSQQWMEVVGVVKDFRQSGVVGPEWPQLLVPFEEAERCAYWVPRDFSLLVRGSEPRSLVQPLRRLVHSLGPTVAIRDVRSMGRIKRDAVGDRALLATMMSVAAGLALTLAVVGLYGMVALWVSRRQGELGLRMALGAGPGVLRRLVVAQVGVPVLAGLGGGLAAVAPLAILLKRLLYRVSPVDPVSLLVVVVVLAGTAVLAAAVPARRATRVDPMQVLRTE
jgi:putative ABC transport system permease protein